ncbi:NADH dehydrogenase subunit E [Tistlia consotensis]|uniref:NADH dehydrogenase subunit E n=1 Tax=Tistlia consotensis USBA 355 TaxID=560819 RepID=A0A1Y6BWU7_9PROT|nr:NAD(P)H-dependent oxidoreductase subunit E [Tistlia consotensis]SMF25073.1 NADH dehydrogenase subunit E [Tistlia consotensis USBA 355]SNR60087.1 NADH dehydrogenase subunit E [Tistlia consotensis]
MKVTTYQKPETGSFAFTPENDQKAKAYVARYPEGKQASAVIWLLYLAQSQNGGHLSDEAVEYVAQYLGMAPIRVHEVVSFYTMLNDRPVGRHLIQVCRTTSCWLRGSDEIAAACLEAAGVDQLGGTSADGLFTVTEVECLGACCNAPMFQVNDADYYEDLTPETAKAVIEALRRGEQPKPGSQSGRLGSLNEDGPTTLKDTFTDTASGGAA